jgi:hypothetical protein
MAWLAHTHDSMTRTRSECVSKTAAQRHPRPCQRHRTLFSATSLRITHITRMRRVPLPLPITAWAGGEPAVHLWRRVEPVPPCRPQPGAPLAPPNPPTPPTPSPRPQTHITYISPQPFRNHCTALQLQISLLSHKFARRPNTRSRLSAEKSSTNCLSSVIACVLCARAARLASSRQLTSAIARESQPGMEWEQ